MIQPHLFGHSITSIPSGVSSLIPSTSRLSSGRRVVVAWVILKDSMHSTTRWHFSAPRALPSFKANEAWLSGTLQKIALLNTFIPRKSPLHWRNKHLLTSPKQGMSYLTFLAVLAPLLLPARKPAATAA